MKIKRVKLQHTATMFRMGRQFILWNEATNAYIVVDLATCNGIIGLARGVVMAVLRLRVLERVRRKGWLY